MMGFFRNNINKITFVSLIFIIGVLIFSIFHTVEDSEGVSIDRGSRKLKILAWGEWFDDDMLDEFEKEFNCNIYIDFASSPESMLAKSLLSKDMADYDLIFPCRESVKILYKNGAIEPVNISKINRFSEINENINTIDNCVCSLPYMKSINFLIYNKKAIEGIDEDTLRSMKLFVNKDFAGRIGLINDKRTTIAFALKELGYSINTRSAEELRKASDLMMEWRKNIAYLDSDLIGQDIILGNIAVATCDVNRYMMEDNEWMVTRTSDAGIIYTLDEICIAKRSSVKDLSYDFINFLLRKENIETMSNKNASIPSIDGGEAWKVIKEKSKISDKSEANAEILEYVECHTNKYDEIWKVFQEGNILFDKI